MHYRFIGSLLFLIIVFPYCKKEENNDCPATSAYQALMPSAKEWFPYTANRTIIFENATLRDTLELKDFFSGNDVVWNGDRCPASSGEFLRGNIIDKKSADTIKVEIGYGEQVIIKKNKGYLYYYDTKKQLVQQSATKRFESSVILNNKTYTSVLVFECSSDDKCSSNGLTKFYFSKTKGLVAYQRNNVLWTLR